MLEEYRHVGSATLKCPAHWADEAAVEKELELEAMGAAKIKSFLAKLKAERYLVGQYLSGVLIKGDDAAARGSLEAAGFPVSAERELKFNRQQRFLEESIASRVAAVQKARAAEDEAEIEELLADAQRNARPIAGLGPPGTGKTTVVGSCVDKVLTDGGRVLYALPTAQQAARVRARHPEADVDTCAAAFYLWKQNADERMDVLEQYDLVVVDEVSQLDAQQFERILQMWAVADKMPALVFTGDFWQLPGVNNSQATDSPKWKTVFVVDLHEMWRCKDEALRKKLHLLRTAAPTAEQLADICRGRKAWTHAGDPTAEEIEGVLRKHPDTTVATCTRRGASIINQLSIQALFKKLRKPILGELGLDWEANPDNYKTGGGATAGVPQPLRQDIYAGMRLHLTRNVNKRLDFVNGMEATVRGLDAASGCLHVTTATGKELALFPFTEELDSGGKVTCYPARPGYASTVHKLQGSELAHITIWLDVKRFKAAGYVALSRVRRDSDYLLGGRLEPEHFLPAH